MLTEDLATKPFVLAVGNPIFPVHVVRQEDREARSVCGVQPDEEWARVWREPVNLRERPDGLCRECWHSTRFAETFEAELR